MGDGERITPCAQSPWVWVQQAGPVWKMLLSPTQLNFQESLGWLFSSHSYTVPKKQKQKNTATRERTQIIWIGQSCNSSIQDNWGVGTSFDVMSPTCLWFGANIFTCHCNSWPPGRQPLLLSPFYRWRIKRLLYFHALTQSVASLSLSCPMLLSSGRARIWPH